MPMLFHNRVRSHALSVNRSHKRSTRRERGTILVLALAVLAVLALSGVAYVSVVSVERGSVEANTNKRNFDSQADTVEDYIGSLLVADLFGNKLVTPGVPRSIEDSGDRFGVWPRFMEDFDYTDATSTERDWAQQNSSDYDSSVNMQDPWVVLNPFVLDAPADNSIARVDDAWLASSEPDWNAANISNTNAWGQITNLRSVFIWDEDARGTDPEDGRWVRQDGRFVDLGVMFDESIPAVNGFGNPTIDLSVESELGAGYGTLSVDPTTSTSLSISNAFSLQIDEIDSTDGLSLADEREWVDTDGDLRPDARWQQLDVLGDRFGLKWVVAARIVDASALINVNSSIEFPTVAQVQDDDLTNDVRIDAHFVGDGRTPADIDLFRLLTYNWGDNGSTAITPSNSFADSRSVNLDFMLQEHGSDDENAYRNFIERSLRLPSVVRATQGLTDEPYADSRLAEVTGELSSGAYDTSFFNQTNRSYRFNTHSYSISNSLTGTGFEWGENFSSGATQQWTPLTREQRAAWWSAFGSSPLSPRAPGGVGFDLSEMEELRSYFGTNDGRRLSPLEIAFDGPDSVSDVLPTADKPFATDPTDEVGPLRSWENPRFARSFDDDTPTLDALYWDNRRQLTTISGARSIAPILIRPADVDGDGIISDGIISGATAGFEASSPGPNEAALLRELDLEPRIKLPLESFATSSPFTSPAADPTLARWAFDAFAWSLMPFATANDAQLDGEIIPNAAPTVAQPFPATNGNRDRAISAFIPELDIADAIATPEDDQPWVFNGTATPDPLQFYGGAGGIDPTSTAYAPSSTPNTDLYGSGSVNSPAQWFETWLHRLPAAGTNIDRIGIHYALYRALAMTANLFDASDQAQFDPSLIQAGDVSLEEQPTVLRFFNVLGFDDDIPTAASQNRIAGPEEQYIDVSGLPQEIVPLSRRLVFGDIPEEAINPDPTASDSTYVGPRDAGATALGNPTNPASAAGGLTVVGLDRQPFLAGIYTYAMYQTQLLSAVGSVSLDPLLGGTDPNEGVQVGSVIAIEVFNPWQDPIDVSEYRVRLSRKDTSALTNADANADLWLDIELNFATTNVIAAGETAVFIWHTLDRPTLSPTANVLETENLFGGTGTYEDTFITFLAPQLTSGRSATVYQTSSLDRIASPTGTAVLPDFDDDGDDEYVVFSAFNIDTGAAATARGPFVASLIYDGFGTTGNEGYVVDRLSRDPNANFRFRTQLIDPANDDEPWKFPGGLETAVSASGTAGGAAVGVTGGASQGGMRMHVYGALTRPVTGVTQRASGFPGSVIERPGENRRSIFFDPAPAFTNGSGGQTDFGYTTIDVSSETWATPSLTAIEGDIDDGVIVAVERRNPVEGGRNVGPLVIGTAAQATAAKAAVTSWYDDIQRGDRIRLVDSLNNETVFTLQREVSTLTYAGLPAGHGERFETAITGQRLNLDPTTSIDAVTGQHVLSATTPLPPVELFVPDTALTHVSDVMLVSSVAHMYVHDEVTGTNTNSDGEQLQDDDRPSVSPASLDPTTFGPGRWLTVSEQLGFDWELYANPSEIDRASPTPYANAIPNPYAGKLNPVRDVLAVDAPVPTNITRQFALPTALRVLDMFEGARPANATLVQGKININTATTRVLESLPGLAPYGDQYRLQADGTRNATAAARERLPIGESDGYGGTADRVDMIIGYRDRRADLTTVLGALNNGEPSITPFTNYSSNGNGSQLVTNTPRAYTGIPGHRQYVDHISSSFDPAEQLRRGFTSIGELMTLAKYRTWSFGGIDIPVEPRPVDTLASLTIPFNTGSPPQRTFTELVDQRAGSPTAFTNDERFLPLQPRSTANVPAVPGYTPVTPGRFIGQQLSSDSIWESRLAEYADLDASGSIDAADAVIGHFDSIQGVDEHYAILRQVANVIETRSDVYIVTYVLRGYDPDVISRVPIESSIDETLRNPLLRTPAYETRRLVIYDRSGVNSPTDRPRVLLSVELPPATP